MRGAALGLGLSLILGGCSDAGSSPGNTGGTGGSGTTLTERITVVAQPSTEAHVCVTKRLTNSSDVWIHRLHATISGGSHHLIVDRSRDPSENLVPTPCLPLSGTDASRLMIAQQHETVFRMPEGIAYLLPASQLITLELHYVNTTTQPMTVEGVIELDTLPAGVTPQAEAEMRFTGGTSIALPPRSPGSAQSFHPIEANTHVFGMTSHTHSRGVRSTIERTTSAAANGTLLHESTNWAEPPLSRFDPALAFDGSDGLLLTCQYQNDTDREIGFSTSVTGEMCFMWLYFYPPRGGN